MGDNKRLFHFRDRRSQDPKHRNHSPDPSKIGSFLRKRVKSFRDVPPGPNQYDDLERRYKPREEVAEEDLETILSAHDGDPETKLKVKECSWNTVLEQMVEAKEEDSSKTDYNSAFMVSVQMASQYIAVIPEEYGLGVIKGGLALVFEATKRRVENKQKILDAFETIPEAILTINTAFALLKPEPEDTDIQLEFFSTLITHLPVLIKILLGKEAWYQKIVRFLLLSIPETLTIDDILSTWNSQVTNLKEHVQRMKIKILSKVDSKIDDLTDQVKTSEANIKGQIKTSESEIKDQIKSSEISIVTLLSDNKLLQVAMMGQMRRLQDIIPQQLSDFFRAQQASNAAMTGLYEEIRTLHRQYQEQYSRAQEEWTRKEQHYHLMLERSQQKQDQLEHKQHQLECEKSNLGDQVGELTRQVSSQSIRNQAQAISSAVTPIQLLGMVGVSTNAAWDDLDIVLRESTQFDAESQAKARWLIMTPEFHGWLQGRRSSLLLADGATTEHIRLVSPMSGFCAILAPSLANDPGCIALFFFAGLHCQAGGADRDLNGPKGIVRSLIAQLLLNSKLQRPNLNFLSPALLKDCKRQNLKALCDVFVHLAEQVPLGIELFCIVDGISWYEQPLWLKDLHFIVSMFEHLAKKIGALKVLMTSPGKSIEIVERTMETDSVWRHVSLAAGHAHPGTFVKPQKGKGRGNHD